MKEPNSLENLAEEITKLTNIKKEQIKLEAVKITSVLGSDMISSIYIGLTILFFIFFISLSIGMYISSLIGINYSGIAIIGAFYLFIGTIMIIFRKKLIANHYRNQIINKILNNTL